MLSFSHYLFITPDKIILIQVQLAADLTKSSHKLSNEVQSKEFKEEKSKKKSKPHVTDQVLGEVSSGLALYYMLFISSILLLSCTCADE